MRMKSFIQRHSLITYFFMTFTISWLGAFLVVAPNLIQGKPITQIDGLLMFPVLLLGPSVSGLTLTALLDGKKGLRDLFARMGRWHVGGYRYIALLIPPVLVTIVLLCLRVLVSPVFTPHLNLLGIGYGIVPGFLEEIGWTGFVLPRLRQQHSPLVAGLLLGVPWGLWHLPVIDFLGAAYPHGAYWLPYALAFVAAMTAMRILIVWITANTGSILLAQLLHAISTASLVVLSPLLITPGQEAGWYALYALALWIVVAGVVLRTGKQLTLQRHQVLQPIRTGLS